MKGKITWQDEKAGGYKGSQETPGKDKAPLCADKLFPSSGQAQGMWHVAQLSHVSSTCLTRQTRGPAFLQPGCGCERQATGQAPTHSCHPQAEGGCRAEMGVKGLESSPSWVLCCLKQATSPLWVEVSPHWTVPGNLSSTLWPLHTDHRRDAGQWVSAEGLERCLSGLRACGVCVVKGAGQLLRRSHMTSLQWPQKGNSLWPQGHWGWECPPTLHGSLASSELYNVSEAEHPGHPAHSCYAGGQHLEPEESSGWLTLGLLNPPSASSLTFCGMICQWVEVSGCYTWLSSPGN